MSSETPQIVIDFLLPEHERLLRQCAEVINSSAAKIHVAELGRYGKTGARLLQTYFHEQKRGIPFVVKIDRKSKIKREHEATEKIKIYFEDSLIGFGPFYSGDWGAIIYPKVGRRELKDVLYRPEKEESIEFVVKCLEKLYDHTCARAHGVGSDPETRKEILVKEYQWYLRNYAADERIRPALGRHHGDKRFVYLGANIVNPLMMLKQGFQKPVTFRCGAVHGDLHPNNVVLGHDGTPRLIDFAWGNVSAHILKDFVLMENSVRFLLFPNHVDLSDQLKVDQLLLKENGNNDICLKVQSKELKEYYNRMAAIVGVLRTRARKACGDSYRFEEYLAAQFLVLYGLMKYPDYNFQISLRALGMIAGKLADTEFGF